VPVVRAARTDGDEATVRRLVGLLLAAACVGGCTANRVVGQPQAAASGTPIATEPCLPGTERPVPGGLPDLTLPCFTPAGGRPITVRLATLRGPLLVNFWATWCDLCHHEMPALQRIHRVFGTRLQVLGINVFDDAPEARRTIQETGVTYPSLFDPDDQVRDALRFGQFQPITVLVDEDGRVVARHFGELTDTEIREFVRTELGIAA
jgi:thiol-disulfide isomerase/thioredoxin